MVEQVKEHSDKIKYSNWVYSKKIPPEVCDLIISEFKSKDLEYGTVGNDYRIDFNARLVKGVEIPLDHWCLGLLLYYGIDANIENFNYNVTNLALSEFFTYEEGMFYKPHVDVSSNTNHPTHYRKLTVIIQLSDNTDYSGGDLILYDTELNENKMPRERGTIIVFNSNTTHSITKVTSGTRHSLCGWMMGPPFA